MKEPSKVLTDDHEAFWTDAQGQPWVAGKRGNSRGLKSSGGGGGLYRLVEGLLTEAVAM